MTRQSRWVAVVIALALCLLSWCPASAGEVVTAADNSAPLRVAVAGLVHGHA